MSEIPLRVQKFGQIQNAEVQLADLTVLVGPQATGKSILLQLLKVLLDTRQVLTEMTRYGLDWEHNVSQFLEVYMGEGMGSLWTSSTGLCFNGTRSEFEQVRGKRKTNKRQESAFFIPAQRVLAVRDGWPRPFSDYSAGDPFVVRNFSETLRRLMTELQFAKEVFPHPKRLKNEIRGQLEESIFSGFALKIEKKFSQKRLALKQEGSEQSLPFMVWSAGQREFVPLLLGMYWLLPAGNSARRKDVQWVIIEELEMGLHPAAISVVLLMVLELLSRGYRVCLSSHSQHVLDMVWAIRSLGSLNSNPANLLRLFKAHPSLPMVKLASECLKKTTRVYSFDRTTGTTHDISNLDPASSEMQESGWGGINEFSGRAADVVAEAVNASSTGPSVPD
jgi:energy-coupling factor transporter ATP-binding protein EcfA2